MFNTRYQFEAKFNESISFAANEMLLGLRKENDYWLYVYHSDGRLGAVPINYVQEKRLEPSNAVSEIIASALKAVKTRDVYDRDSLISYLTDLKQYLSSENGKSPMPALPLRKKEKAPSPKVKAELSTSTSLTSQLCPPKPTVRAEKSEYLPSGTSFLMLDQLRAATNSNHYSCVQGFLRMLHVLSELAPQHKQMCQTLEGEMLNSNHTVRRSVYAKTGDWKALQKHIAQLEQRTKNQEESSWPLVEDESAVVADLDAFSELLCNANEDMVRTCLNDDKLPLVLSYLYQMEKRILVRRFYLLVVVATCHIQPALGTVFLDSNLPTEIIRELRSQRLDELDFVLDLRVLTVLLAKNNSLPVNIQNELNLSLFECIFQNISANGQIETGEVADLLDFSGDSTPRKEDRSLPPIKAMRKLDLGLQSSSIENNGHHDASNILINSFVQFILSANRHFCVQPHEKTPIMQCLLNKYLASRDLLESLLRIFNRGGDPLNLNGVSFVRTLRGNLLKECDLSSTLYAGSSLYLNESGQSSRRNSVQGQTEDGLDYGNDSQTNERSRHRSGITNATIQLAPDTPKNAARKLLSDIFSSKRTAGLIYSNDVDVIVDVIIRQLSNLSANSPDIPEYIFCVDKLIRNSDYMKRGGGYRSDDLVESLQGVEFNASQMACHDFTTTRSVRLTKGVLQLLASHGNRIT